MWTQLLVIVGYYGLAAPRLCLARREEPSLVAMFKRLFSGKPGFGLSGRRAENRLLHGQRLRDQNLITFDPHVIRNSSACNS